MPSINYAAWNQGSKRWNWSITTFVQGRFWKKGALKEKRIASRANGRRGDKVRFGRGLVLGKKGGDQQGHWGCIN